MVRLHLLFFHIMLILLLHSLSNPATLLHASSTHHEEIKASDGTADAAMVPVSFQSIFAFGDSLTDTGNALIVIETDRSTQMQPLGLQGRAPYGETFFHKPAGRFSDGRLLVDFLVEELGASDFLEPWLAVQLDKSGGLNSSSTVQGGSSSAHEYLINFAVAGATALSAEYLKSTYNITGFTPLSLDRQLQWFSNLSISKDKEAMSKALIFLGEIGGNDYNYAFGKPIPFDDIVELVPRVISQMEDALEFMVNSGVRYIVVQGDYPMGCLPVYKKMYTNSTMDEHGCVEEINNVIHRHNTLLAHVLANLTSLYNNTVSFIFLDSEKAFMEVFNNPSQYGFSDREQPCYDISDFFFGLPINLTSVEVCEDPSTHMVWDGPHLTEAMNKVVLDLFLTQGGLYANPFPNFLPII